MTKTDRRALTTLLLALVLISSGCGDGGGGPTSPTAPVMPTAPVAPMIPMVAGTYTGPTSIWLEGQLLGTFATTVTVVQTNARVTMSGIIESGRFQYLTNSGTIDADGRYTLDPDTVIESESCGVLTFPEVDVVFGDGTLRWRVTQHSECGPLRSEANLVRSGS